MRVFNLEVHAHLIELGYTFAFREADFEDVGNGETGPILKGGPAYNEYASDEDYIFIDHKGHFAHYEKRDLAWENWIDEQYGVQG